MSAIVTGVELSNGGAHALDRALLEAHSTGRPVRALHVWSPLVWLSDLSGMSVEAYALSLSLPADSLHGAQERAEEALEAALKRHRAAMASGAGAPGPVSARADVLEGAPGRVLVEASQQAGLLVVGGRSHGVLTSALIGSTSSYAMHHAACPVMIVPISAITGAVRRIVVGFDDSACSRSALRWAFDAAERHGCPLSVVHALRITLAPAALPIALISPAYHAEMQTWLDLQVARVAGDFAGVACTATVRNGSPAGVLLEEAGEQDLLVVGSRGHGGFVGLLLGSVAGQCSQHARGAVVVVRAGAERLATDEP